MACHKITLDDVKPHALRRIEVPLSVPLDRPYVILQGTPAGSSAISMNCALGNLTPVAHAAGNASISEQLEALRSTTGFEAQAVAMPGQAGPNSERILLAMDECWAQVREKAITMARIPRPPNEAPREPPPSSKPTPIPRMPPPREPPPGPPPA